jgi:tetratricopeptide (TPR) repeat protein
MRTDKMSRIISFILCLLFFGYSSGYAQNKSDSYRITVAQWQSDLSYLQKKIHSDYSNLFYNVTAKQFDSAVAVLKKDIPHLTENEIRVGFIRLIAMFKIGHTMVRMGTGENEDSLKPMFHHYPMTIYSFNDGLYIRNIDARYKEAVGGRIIKIGNLTVDAVLKKMHSVISCENEQYFKQFLQKYLRKPEILQALQISRTSDSLLLTYTKDGAEKEIQIKAENSENYKDSFWPTEIKMPSDWIDAHVNFNKPAAALWLKDPYKLRYFEYLKESKTVYVRHSSVMDEDDETIADYFKKVFAFIDSNEVEKFVLDIRLNGGGNNYLNKALITKIIESKKINRYGHLFVITGAATFSAAQNLTNELEKYTEAIFVGEPTAENVNFWGDIKTELLPLSKLNVNLSWLWWQNMDPRDKRPWTAPNLAAEMSFENYKAGYDSAMNIILNFKEEKRIDEKIKGLVTVGNFDEALSITKEYMDNPLHRYCKNELEEKINDMAYSLLMRGKPEAANRFFLMNVQFFPNSANAYDSYAESLYRLGKKEEAVKCYEIASSKDPGGPIGKNSREKLAMIRGK